MVKIKSIAKAVAAAGIASIFISGVIMTSSVTKAFADSSDITDQDLIKLAEAMDMSTDSETYDLGSNAYDIFDYSSEGFSSLFTSANLTDAQNVSYTGWSRSEISSAYSERASTASDLKVAISQVSANIDVNFNTSVSSSLDYVNEEYFEYFERYQQTRVITVNWYAQDLTSYFSSVFIKDLNNISSVDDAVEFLSNYGTHVFMQYYMGGSLIITNYIASEESITETYESEGVSIGLSTQIASAVSANSSGSDYSIESQNVSNETTTSSMNMRARGGMNFNALTVDDLFTYKQEYFTGSGSGYIYTDWINSLDDRQNEVVIKTNGSVSVWELLENSDYYDAEKEDLLIQAFDIMSYSNYAKLCVESGESSDIISSVSYTANGSDVEFSITSDTIYLPSNITAVFEIGSVITDYYDVSAVSMKITSGSKYAKLDGTKLTINSEADGGELAISLYLNGSEIYELSIEISDDTGGYDNGYGTADQPYLIATAAQWNAFITGTFDSPYYYKLANDIDLGGNYYDVGGSSARSSFIGEFDGNGYTLSNFTIIAKSEWQNIGIFGENSGTIQNVALENVVVMNSGIISANSGDVNAGILVGSNNGQITNVTIDDSSIRVSTQLSSAQLNIGAVSGYSIGDISECGVTNCNIYGLTWKGSGTANVGGVVGQLYKADMTECYARYCSINASNESSSSATYTLGGLIGYVYSSTDEEEEVTATVSYCIAYENTFNTTSGAFGYIAGSSVANNSFNNCYYQALIELSVNNGSMNGCSRLRSLTLENIGSSIFNQYWTTDNYGVVLKVHTEG